MSELPRFAQVQQNEAQNARMRMRAGPSTALDNNVNPPKYDSNGRGSSSFLRSVCIVLDTGRVGRDCTRVRGYRPQFSHDEVSHV